MSAGQLASPSGPNSAVRWTRVTPINEGRCGRTIPPGTFLGSCSAASSGTWSRKTSARSWNFGLQEADLVIRQIIKVYKIHRPVVPWTE